MASFADILSASQAPAAPPPPVPADPDQQPAAPAMTVLPPKALVTGGKPTSFADIQKAAADTSPPPAGFKDDNGPSAGDVVKDVAKQAGSAAVEGPIMMTVGAPGDFASASKSGGPFDKAFLGLTHKIQDWTGLGPQAGTPDRQKFDSDYLGGTKALDPVWNAVQTPTTQGILDTAGIQLPQPQTTAGRYTRTGVDFAAGALAGDAPAVLARGVESGAAPAVVQAAKIAAPAAISGAGAQGATDLANLTGNSDLAPIAQIAGAALTHGAMSGATSAASRAASAVADSPTVAKALTVTPGLRTVGQNMQEGIAARRFAGSVSDMPAFLESLKPTPAGDSAVPGFNPTTYQLTGDAGVGQLELASKGGEDRAAQFVARTDQQKAAQAQAAKQMTSPGDPAAVAQMADDHMSALDTAADDAHATAYANAQQQASAIGGGQTPDEIGADMRSHLDDASAASKQGYRDLYSVVNPDGTLGADTTGITAAADKIYGQMSPTSQAFLSPQERTFAGILDQYQPTMPFNEVVELKSELAESLRAARATPGQGRAVSRMSALMQPIQDAISGAVKSRAGDEAQAVSAGQMAPENTMEARLKADVDRFLANRTVGLAVGSEGIGNSAGTGSISFAGVPGATGQSTRGPRGAPSDPGVPPQAYRLPTAEDAAGLRAADAAFKQHQQTYNEGPLKPVMAPGPRPGEYKLADYAVPRQVLRNGPAGYRSVKAYLDGANNTPEAVEAVKSAATETLRPQIKDGMLGGAALAAWKNRQSHVLRAIDEASPGFSRQFDDAASASDAVLQHARAKVEQAKAFKASTIGKFLGVDDPGGVVARVGRMIASDDGVSKMRELAEATKANPDAADGLRNAAGQWIAQKVTSLDKIGATDERALDPRQFRKLLAKNEPALREVLTPDQIDVAARIADTMDQAQRSVKGNRLEGGSDTAQKLAAQKLFKSENSGGHVANLGLMGMLAEGASLGLEHGGVKGAAIGAVPAGAGYLIKTLRSAGLHDIQHIAFDAVMNPDRARQLMKRLGPNEFRERRLDGALRASFIRQGGDDPDKPPGGGAPPPNEPPPTGPFSRDGAGASAAPFAADSRSRTEPQVSTASAGSAQADDRGRIEPSMPNVPLTRRQARFLLGDGHAPEVIGKMTSQERADAVRDAVDRGVTPAARLNPDDMAKMSGALPHAVHDGRTGDGRFSQVGDILSHPDINGRIESTWHPDADATHNAILNHEKRLNDIAGQLRPDASIKEVADTTKQAADDVLAMVRAYHGTAHKFDRFDLSKIGSGEGNQAYGHGLYFAENENVAKGYRDSTSSHPILTIDGRAVPHWSGASHVLTPKEADAFRYARSKGVPVHDDAWMKQIIDYAKDMAPEHVDGLQKLAKRDRAVKMPDATINGQAFERGDLPAPVRDAYDHIKEVGGDVDEAVREARGATMKKSAAGDQIGADFWTQREGVLQSLKDQGFKLGGEGHLYNAAIDREPEHFLDWDARVSKQSSHVKGSLQKLGIDPNGAGYGMNVHQDLAKKFGPEEASKKLNEAGLAGIRYLDQGSRGNVAASGTRNYVVFDHNDIKITHRNGQPVSPDERDQVLAMARKAPGDPQQQVRDGITQLADLAVQPGHNHARMPVGRASDWLTSAAADNGLDIAGLDHTVDTSAIRHMLKRHSGPDEQARGGVPLTKSDLASLPDVLSSPDKVAFGATTPRGNAGIAYFKKLADGSTVVLEEVRRHDLAIQSMRKYPATIDVLNDVDLACCRFGRHRLKLMRPAARTRRG